MKKKNEKKDAAEKRIIWVNRNRNKLFPLQRTIWPLPSNGKLKGKPF